MSIFDTPSKAGCCLFVFCFWLLLLLFGGGGGWKEGGVVTVGGTYLLVVKDEIMKCPVNLRLSDNDELAAFQLVDHVVTYPLCVPVTVKRCYLYTVMLTCAVTFCSVSLQQ